MSKRPLTYVRGSVDRFRTATVIERLRRAATKMVFGRNPRSTRARSGPADGHSPAGPRFPDRVHLLAARPRPNRVEESLDSSARCLRSAALGQLAGAGPGRLGMRAVEC